MITKREKLQYVYVFLTDLAALAASVILAWLIVGVGTLVLDCFPILTTELAELIGVASPINMLFFLGFCFSLLIIFVLTVAISRVSIRMKQLTQELALYEKKVNDELKNR